MTFTDDYIAYAEAQAKFENHLTTPEVLFDLDAYSQFMLSDEIKPLLSRAETYVIAYLDRTGWELSAHSDSDHLVLFNYFNSDDETVSIPIRWFSDNEAFRAEKVAEAAARSAAVEADRAALAKAQEDSRRAQYEELRAEFG